MTMTLDALRATVRGPILTDGDAAYDDARQVWNGMFNNRRPDMIVRCQSAADVIGAVNYARENNLLVAVRGGGHSFPGFSVCDGGLMIDLAPMKSVRVDPAARRVRAEPGVLWAELDREAEAFGLATPGGMISHTGIAGLTLGGGFGWIGRKHGLVIDNLISCDIVTAKGELVHASATENPDLFWALRGGGGNFGIVTSFEYQLHPQGLVMGGLIFFPQAQAQQVLRGYQEFMKTAPDEFGGVGALLMLPTGDKSVAISPFYAGDPAEGMRLIEPLRKLGTVIMEQVGPMPYTVAQQLFNPGSVPHNRYYVRSNLNNGISDEAIEILREAFDRSPSPLNGMVLVAMGGAIARVPADATAYFHRDADYNLSLIGSWLTQAEDEPNIAWLRDLWDKLTPHLPNRVYVNELYDEGADRVKAAYGSTFTRLQQLKQKYDPQNLFRLNQNIPPA
jgi:FAD/FMN-containing dehydrogenase